MIVQKQRFTRRITTAQWLKLFQPCLLLLLFLLLLMMLPSLPEFLHSWPR